MNLMNTLYVTDMTKSVAFYKALGLTRHGDGTPDTYWNEFHLGDAVLALHLADTVPLFPDGRLDLILQVDSREALERSRTAVLTTGARLDRDIEDIGFGPFFYLKDPDGLVVTVMQATSS